MITTNVERETFAIIWLGLDAAQRLRESFAQSTLPDEESHPNSSSAGVHADGEIGEER